MQAMYDLAEREPASGERPENGPRVIGGLRPAFREVFTGLEVSSEHPNRLALVRMLQSRILGMSFVFGVLPAAYLLSSDVGDGVRDALPPFGLGVAVTATVKQWLFPSITRWRIRLARQSEGLTLFRQLRFEIPLIMRLGYRASLRFKLKALVVMAPDGLMQHTVTRQVLFIARRSRYVRLGWWRARWVVWCLQRHVNRHQRYYLRETRAGLLDELAETLRGFRGTAAPGQHRYSVLCEGGRPDPVLVGPAPTLATRP
jgi:hypothetical protein